MSVKLKLLVGDSKLQVKQAKAEVLRLAQRGCVGFIGPASSGPATEVSDLLSLGPIDRAVISYSATSPTLSDSRFSNFLRTAPSDDIQANLMAKLMKSMFVAFFLFLSRVQNDLRKPRMYSDKKYMPAS